MIIERGYLDHWKTALLRRLTSLPEASEIPIRLWEHCQSRMDDLIADKDGSIIAAICRWTGKPDALTHALVECRWIEKTRAGWLVLGWRERQVGHFARQLNGKKGGRPRKPAGKGTPAAAKTPPPVTTSEPNSADQGTGGNRQVISGSQNPPDGNRQGGRGDEIRGDEKRRPLPSPRGQETDGLSPEESRLRIFALFNRTASRRLGYEAEHALAALSPIAKESMAAVEWFYGLPAEAGVHELHSRHRSVEKLILSFNAAVDVALGFAKKTGRGAFAPKKEEALPWPPGAETWLRNAYPHADVPDRFSDLPLDLQREFHERVEVPA